MRSLGTYMTVLGGVNTCRIHGNSIQRQTSSQSAATWNNRDKTIEIKCAERVSVFMAMHLWARRIYAFVICIKSTWRGKYIEASGFSTANGIVQNSQNIIMHLYLIVAEGKEGAILKMLCITTNVLKFREYLRILLKYIIYWNNVHTYLQWTIQAVPKLDSNILTACSTTWK